MTPTMLGLYLLKCKFGGRKNSTEAKVLYFYATDLGFNLGHFSAEAGIRYEKLYVCPDTHIE